MVNGLGGKEAADRLLARSEPSDGFTELFLRGKDNLRISIEYLVLQTPWRELFTDEQLAVARHRLLAVECELPPEDATAQTESYVVLPLPEEVPAPESLIEGARTQVTINAYERNPVARHQCIKHYGPVCAICGFSFGSVYGPETAGFIHVHHITPLAEIGTDYNVDPIVDLRPVCPNCHAVIHLNGNCRTIAEVKAMMATERNA